MKIVTPTFVKIQGHGPVYGEKTFWLQKDDGERFSVKIPDHPNIIAQFEWLSDNDCLIHLKDIVPRLDTNEHERSWIQEINKEQQEQWAEILRRGQATKPSNPFGPMGPTPTKVPEAEWSVTWSFWCSDRAIMFKLAMGGNQ